MVAPLPALRTTAAVGAEAAPMADLNGKPSTAGVLRALQENFDSLFLGGL